MRKGEKRLFFSVLAILTVALLLLAMQWAGGDSMHQIYHVTVLLDGSDGEYWKNLKAGMDQAAAERDIDLRFISRYDGDSTQAQTLRTEWEGEADGVILVPADGGALAQTLQDVPTRLVVGVLGPRLESDRVDCYLTPDYADMGKGLASAAAELAQGADCILYISADAGAVALEIALRLEEHLAELGTVYRRVILEPTAQLEPLEEAPDAVRLAVEPEVTERLCASGYWGGRICGVGTSSRLLHYLEDGTAAALVVFSDYDAGYLSLSQVAARLSRGEAPSVTLESYTATRETMFEEPMINILFSAY